MAGEVPPATPGNVATADRRSDRAARSSGVSGSSDVNTTTAGIDPVPTKSPSCRCTVVASADSGRYAVASLLDTSSTLPKYGPPTAAAASQAAMITVGNAI